MTQTDSQTAGDKSHEFVKAMQTYHACPYYNQLPAACGSIVIATQCLAVFQLCRHLQTATLGITLTSLAAAWLATDFINGLIHLYMDNNTRYHSLAGPLIAAFHLHHKKPQYRKRPILKVYFDESGGKFWLPFYMLAVLGLQAMYELPWCVEFFLVATGILSSIAELSHYWCHNANNDQWIIRALQQTRILLSKKHHALHHTHDNTHYAFLNGVTDPLINCIARLACQGYKHHSDRHALAYLERQTANRQEHLLPPHLI